MSASPSRGRCVQLQHGRPAPSLATGQSAWLCPSDQHQSAVHIRGRPFPGRCGSGEASPLVSGLLACSSFHLSAGVIVTPLCVWFLAQCRAHTGPQEGGAPPDASPACSKGCGTLPTEGWLSSNAVPPSAHCPVSKRCAPRYLGMERNPSTVGWELLVSGGLPCAA